MTGLVTCLALALVVSVGAGWFEPVAADDCAAPVPTGSLRVVIVVDPGSGGAASTRCMVVAEGTTGAQLLAQRARELGRAQPRYANSGLLCAIDAFPATGCGEAEGDGFSYWAHFSGTSGSWIYSSFNPFSRRLRDGDIEGWHFAVKASGTSAPPPRVAPSRSLFPPLVSAPATPTVVDPGSAAAAGSAPAVPAGPGAPAPETTAEPSTGPDVGASADPTAGLSGAGAVESAVGAGAPGGGVGADDVGRWVGLGVVASIVVALGWGARRRTGTT